MSGTTLEQTQGSAEWKHGLFGCFQDKKLCVLACCVPCFVVGKNAEGLGEDCMLHGLLACVGLQFGPLIRWRLRQDKNIKGSMLMDVLAHGVCPCCALVQDAREIAWDMPQELSNPGGGAKKQDQEMTRE